MNIEELREYCLSIKGATEDMPFDNEKNDVRIFVHIECYLTDFT